MNKTDFLKQNLIAHRGLFNNKDIPENSIKAFEEAMKNNYIIELDVHVLKDNEIVVVHDHNLKRLASVDKIIEDMTYKEVKNLKLLKTNYSIPTLNEVLKLVNGKVPIIVEIKSESLRNTRLCNHVSNILDKYKGKYVIKSFNPFVVIWYKKHRPNVTRGLLLSNKENIFKEKLSRNKLLFKKCNPDFISCYYKMMSNKKIKEYKKDHIVLAWTIKSKEIYDEYKNYFDNLICENINELK